jgi:hypothetical protein
MYSTRILMLLVLGAAFAASSMRAQDLSNYRQFRLESDLVSVAKQTGMKPSDAKTIHDRPALIQEMAWYPNRTLGASARTPIPSTSCASASTTANCFRSLFGMIATGQKG